MHWILMETASKLKNRNKRMPLTLLGALKLGYINCIFSKQFSLSSIKSLSLQIQTGSVLALGSYYFNTLAKSL